MKKVTERALRSSIRHWENCATGKEAAGDGDSCALCQRFAHDSFICKIDDGEKCPVYENTGVVGCDETPRELWVFATGDAPTERKIRPQTRDHLIANAEVLFLRSLLP